MIAAIGFAVLVFLSGAGLELVPVAFAVGFVIDMAAASQEDERRYRRGLP